MKKYLMATVCFLVMNQNNFAAHNPQSSLYEKRIHVINRYLVDLENADYHDITQLFTHNGFVISTSKGRLAAKDFFYDFLPNIVTAHLKKHQQYTAKQAEIVGTRFYLSFTLKNGEQHAGEYIDEFVFAPNTDKLNAVYMFENKFFPEKYYGQKLQ